MEKMRNFKIGIVEQTNDVGVYFIGFCNFKGKYYFYVNSLKADICMA